MLRWTLLIFFLLLQTSCDQSATNEPIVKVESPRHDPLQATTLLQEPTEVHVFETTAEALTIWRRAANDKPTLLLLSNNPHLNPVPEPLRQKSAILVNNAKIENIRLATTDRNPSPLMLPGMAVDIALRSGWFSELAWALPLRDAAQELDLEKFKAQLSSSGIADTRETETMTLNKRLLSGNLRGTPFRAAALPLLKLNGPVIVHIDLSYFQPIYKNEISTPLLDIIFQTIQTLKKMNLNTLAVTFSYGHLDSQIALDVRFIGDIVAHLIEDPTRLDQDIPLNWQRQRDSLYLANFFQKDKIRELFEAQEKDEPDAAYVKFNLYRSAADHKEGAKALDYLSQAVALDPVYALEYFELSNMAYNKQRPDEALRMLELAAEVFHKDPFLKLQMAMLANELGEKEKALELLNKVRNLTWSEIFYPHMPQEIADMTAFVRDGVGSEKNAGHQTTDSENQIELVIPDEGQLRERIIHK